MKNNHSIWKFLAILVAIGVGIWVISWQVSTSIGELKIDMANKINKLEQKILSKQNIFERDILLKQLRDENRMNSVVLCLGLLSDSPPNRGAAKQILDGIAKISKISEGTFVEFTAETVNVEPISSIGPKELAAFSGALETGEWVAVLGAELPVSSEERWSFLESKLSKTTWYVDVADTVRPKLKEVVGVIPSTGTVIMYYAPPPGAGF